MINIAWCCSLISNTKGTAMNISLTAARTKLGELVNQANFHNETTRITRNNIPIAAIISIKDLEELNYLRERVEDLEDAVDVLKLKLETGNDTSTWITHEELMAQLTERKTPAA